MNLGRKVYLLLAAVLGLLLLSAITPAYAATPPALPYDLDGNGHPDLVVGAPTLSDGAAHHPGGLVVLPASTRGLSTTGTVLTAAALGLPAGPDFGVGTVLTSADINRDGYADLAVGQPEATFGGEDEVGAVTVFYGSVAGIDPRRSLTLRGSGAFGAAVVAADLDGDGFADLVVGAPGAEGVSENEETYGASGTVSVFRGGTAGLSTTPASVLRRQTGLAHDHEFGVALAVGNLDGDGRPDLVIGAAGARYVDEGYPGSVSVCPGRVGFPSSCTRLAQESTWASLDHLAVADISGDAGPEIVAAVPYDREDAPGSLKILTLVPGSITTLDSEVSLDQDSPGIPGTNEAGDHFGGALAVGDLNRDGYDDVVVGADGETDGKGRTAIYSAGRVTVVYGARGGWRRQGNLGFDQNTKGVPGTSEHDDNFGSAVTLLDHDGDGNLDLTVGAAGENTTFLSDLGDTGTGAITTFTGVRRGFAIKGGRGILGTQVDRRLASSSFGGGLGG